MAIGEYWPYPFPWWSVTPPPNPYFPQPRTVVSSNTTLSISVHPEHKCRVRTSPFDRSLWVVTCQRCQWSATNRNRDSALDDALGHRYFTRDYVLNPEDEQ